MEILTWHFDKIGASIHELNKPFAQGDVGVVTLFSINQP